MKSPSNCLSTIFINTAELLFAEDDEEILNNFKTLYQQKIGFLFFIIIFTNPDIVFVVLKLSRFNVRFEKKHHAAVE